MIKTLIWSVLLYGSEISGTMQKADMKGRGLRNVSMQENRENQLDGT